jgi:hypothetical protein
MKTFKLLVFLAATAVLSVASARSAMAQNQEIKTTFVHLGQGVPGVFYEPVNPGPKAQIAVFIMHNEGDYLTFSGCTELSKRGYRVLCGNTTTAKANVGNMNMDRVLLDAKLGVAWLRKNPDVKKIVLWGHSGGGVLMSSYQNIAENGVKICQGPEKIYKCPDTLAGMPAADGMMLVDSNWGTATMMVFSIDPSVTSEDNGMKLNPDLDLFNPKNGFNAKGNSDFSPEFIKAWQTAVGKRNNALIDSALAKLADIQAGKGPYTDDAPFDIPGGNFAGAANRFFAQDVNLMAHTVKAWPLIHADGSITNEIVHTVRVPEGFVNPTPSYVNGTLKVTVRSFLSTFALRTGPDFGYDEDSVKGIDWSSSYSVPPSSVEGIGVPTLVMGMTGHWEYLAAETIYNHSKATDKTLAFVEGAQHGYTTCKKCEKTPGQFGDTLQNVYNYADKWLSKPGRFLP